MMTVTLNYLAVLSEAPGEINAVGGWGERMKLLEEETCAEVQPSKAASAKRQLTLVRLHNGKSKVRAQVYAELH